MDAVVEAVRPIDGTLDGEASRDAVRRALSDILNRFPEADFRDLAESERMFAVESYVSRDVFNRIHLDLGQTIQSKAPSARVALARSREILDYVRQTVSAAFRALKVPSGGLTGRRISQIVQQALRQTLTVFEDYVQ